MLLLLRPPHPRVPRLLARPRLRDEDRRQARRAAAVERGVPEAVVDAAGGLSLGGDGPLPAGRAAAPAHARLPRGLPPPPQPRLDHHQERPRHARPRPAPGAGCPRPRPRPPLDHLPPRRRDRGDGATDVAAGGAAAGGGGARRGGRAGGRPRSPARPRPHRRGVAGDLPGRRLGRRTFGRVHGPPAPRRRRPAVPGVAAAALPRPLRQGDGKADGGARRAPRRGAVPRAVPAARPVGRGAPAGRPRRGAAARPRPAPPAARPPPLPPPREGTDGPVLTTAARRPTTPHLAVFGRRSHSLLGALGERLVRVDLGTVRRT